MGFPDLLRHILNMHFNMEIYHFHYRLRLNHLSDLHRISYHLAILCSHRSASTLSQIYAQKLTFLSPNFVRNCSFSGTSHYHSVLGICVWTRPANRIICDKSECACSPVCTRTGGASHEQLSIRTNSFFGHFSFGSHVLNIKHCMCLGSAQLGRSTL